MTTISTTAAGELLNVSALRVRQLIHEKRLKAKRIGRDWRIRPADLEAVKVRTNGRPRKS